MASSASPLKRKHDDDGTKSKRKTQFVSSPKMIWTKDDELAILSGIVEYEKKKKLSHSEDWDAFYSFIYGSIHSDFSKVQLKDKVRGLKKKFTFGKLDDNEMFKLSTIIWSDSAPGENMNDALCMVEHELLSEELDLPKDVLYVEHEGLTEKVDRAKDVETNNGEKENKSEEDGVDEFCVLQDAFEAVSFPRISKNQQKLLLNNLRKLSAEKRKELCDEWKALLVEEHRLGIKKLTFATKLAIALE